MQLRVLDSLGRGQEALWLCFVAENDLGFFPKELFWFPSLCYFCRSEQVRPPSKQPPPPTPPCGWRPWLFAMVGGGGGGGSGWWWWPHVPTPYGWRPRLFVVVGGGGGGSGGSGVVVVAPFYVWRHWLLVVVTIGNGNRQWQYRVSRS